MDASEGAESSPQPEVATVPAAPAPRQMSRWPWWVGGIALALLVLGLLAWRLKWYQPAYNAYYKGVVSFKVKEGSTFPVEGATLTLNGSQYKTDSNGKVTLDSITAGTYTVTVHKAGYKDLSQTLTTHRGDNGIEYLSLTKLTEKVYTIRGFAQDYVSGLPIVNAQVVLNDITVQTDPSGAYLFASELAGDYTLHFSKTGYLAQDAKVTLKDADSVTAALPLVPVGTVVFTSNETGKRALYTAHYDGSNKHQIALETTGEDYQPTLSPNGKTVAFLSTRDKVQNAYGAAVPKLYMVGIDGANLKKVSDDIVDGVLKWSANSAYLYFEGFSDPQLTTPIERILMLSTGKTTSLPSGSTWATFTPDSTAVVYVSNSTAGDGTTQYSLAALTMGTAKLTTLVQAQDSAISQVAVSSDGKQVVYDNDTAGSHVESAVSLANGTAQAVLTTPVLSSGTGVLLPGGQYEAFIDTRNGQSDLYTVKVDGSAEQRLTTLGTVNPATAPVWDQTGAYLVFGIKTVNSEALYVVARAGGEPKKIADYYVDATAQ